VIPVAGLTLMWWDSNLDPGTGLPPRTATTLASPSSNGPPAASTEIPVENWIRSPSPSRFRLSEMSTPPIALAPPSTLNAINRSPIPTDFASASCRGGRSAVLTPIMAQSAGRDQASSSPVVILRPPANSISILPAPSTAGAFAEEAMCQWVWAEPFQRSGNNETPQVAINAHLDRPYASRHFTSKLV